MKSATCSNAADPSPENDVLFAKAVEANEPHDQLSSVEDDRARHRLLFFLSISVGSLSVAGFSITFATVGSRCARFPIALVKESGI